MATRSSSSPLPTTATLSRVVFASYIMVSAARRIEATVSPSAGKVATPKLPERCSERPAPSRNRAVRRLWYTAMVAAMPSDFSMSGNSATNSSPPYRKAEFAGPTARFSSPPTSASRRLPIRCPWVSFTGFEAIEIHEHEAEGLARAHLFVQHAVEMPCVEQAGDVVGDGQLLDQRHRPRVLNRNCRVVAEDAQEGDGILRQQVQLAVQQLDYAERLIAGSYGQTGNRMNIQVRVFSREGRPVRVERNVRHDERVAAGCDPARNAFAERHSQTLEAFRIFANRNGVKKFIGLLVDHQERPALRPEELCHLVHDGAQDLFQFEARSQSARYIVEHPKVIHLAAFDDLKLSPVSQNTSPGELNNSDTAPL